MEEENATIYKESPRLSFSYYPIAAYSGRITRKKYTASNATFKNLLGYLMVTREDCLTYEFANTIDLD